jgi:osmoprotectant transport system permease protein
MRGWVLLILGVASLLPLAGCGRRSLSGQGPVVHIGAKAFPESQILGEMLRLLARETGADVGEVRSLGDTAKVWNALQVGQIDAYCEYRGTLTQQVLAGEEVGTTAALRRALARRGLRMSRSLGFSNSYGLGMKKERAEKLGIRTISDLITRPSLKFGLSAPFLDRPDGWQALRKFYGLPQDSREGMEHTLAYTALDNGTLDVTDVYTTDAEIRRRNLLVLADDRHFFPSYEAIILYRADLGRRAPEVVDGLLRLEGTIDEETMIGLNARVAAGEGSPVRVAADFLGEKTGMHVEVVDEEMWQRVWQRTWQHLLLVSVSLALAIVVAVPLGVLSAYRPRLGLVVLGAVGIIQTIPALALLVLLLVLMRRIGPEPAIAALFLYSLLPIVRNTSAGLHDISPSVRESAEALGLSRWARLRLVELPLASRSILAGVKTAAVINVGYATLGGLIGAGGYGQPIMDGVTRNDPRLILEGAVPAVVMALLVQALFEAAERLVVPRGLRLKPAE